jgi:peptidoglycan hydrolase FlgJ
MQSSAVPASQLGIDSRSLDSLRSEAARDPKGAARQTAVQFESMFMQMVLKSMRDATPKPENAGPGGETFTGMLDAQLSKQFAGRPGGLADMIEKQLTRHMQKLPAVSPENIEAAKARAVSQLPAGMTTPAAGNVSPTKAAFIEKMLPHAQQAERETGVPASFIVGQAALESGWGKSEIRNADGSTSFNLFGIKATGWKGATADVMTTEYEGGEAVKQRAKFRSYGSYGEAFSDYARMLANSPRYGNVVRNASTAESFAGGMQRAGYATDPQYAAKLARTINHTLALQRAMA